MFSLSIIFRKVGNSCKLYLLARNILMFLQNSVRRSGSGKWFTALPPGRGERGDKEHSDWSEHWDISQWEQP